MSRIQREDDLWFKGAQCLLKAVDQGSSPSRGSGPFIQGSLQTRVVVRVKEVFPTVEFDIAIEEASRAPHFLSADAAALDRFGDGICKQATDALALRCDYEMAASVAVDACAGQQRRQTGLVVRMSANKQNGFAIEFA